MFQLYFKTGNADIDIHDILYNVGNRIEEGKTTGYILDSNGNKIGEYLYIRDD